VLYLDAARSALGELSQRVGVPTENLVTPDLVRRLCWDWTATADVGNTVAEYLSAGGARNWQRELVVPALSAALSRAGAQESVEVLGD